MELFDNGYQVAWDSTSLKWAETCPYKYKLIMIDGWRPRRKSVHLLFGGWYATALEHYYKHRALGVPSRVALMWVVHETLCATWIDGKPWESDDTNKTRETLIRTIVWYVLQFENEKIEVVKLEDGSPAVEHSFKINVDNGLVFCGHIDRLVNYSGDLYCMDQKTSKSTIASYYFEHFSPDTQMSMYSFAGKIVYNMPIKGVIIDAAQIAVGFSRFERGFTFRTEAQLEEWYDDTLELVETIHHYTEKKLFPKNTTSCGNYGGCEFRHVCSRSPQVREQFLSAEYEKGKPWNPLEPR